ncbi:MAG TPA: TolC family protein [Candidatus Glassbacteria bacterium]|nr:TolC family protein [Candidatus Glassbacteria bacterium]
MAALKRIEILAGCVLLLFSVPVVAQGPLGLWDCVERAVTAHPVADAGAFRREQARSILAADSTLLKPAASLEVHYSARTYIPEIPLPGRSIELGDHHDAGVSLEVSQLLFDWGRRANRIAAAGLTLDAESAGLAARRELLAFEAGSAYLKLLAARRDREIAERYVSSAEEHLRYLQALNDNGLDTYDHLLQARVRLERARVDESRRENAVRLARADLLQRLGQPLTSDLEFGESVGDIPEPDAGSLVPADVITRRPEIALYDRQQESLSALAVSLRAEARPGVRLFARGSFARPGIDQFRNEWISYGSAGVAFDWNFLDWGRSGSRADETLARRGELTANRRIRSQEIALQLERARLESEETGQRLDLARSAVQSAEERFRIVDNLFGQGQVTNTEFLDAREELAVSELELSRAQLEHSLARWQLALASGMISAEVARRWPEYEVSGNYGISR